VRIQQICPFYFIRDKTGATTANGIAEFRPGQPRKTGATTANGIAPTV